MQINCQLAIVILSRGKAASKALLEQCNEASHFASVLQHVSHKVKPEVVPVPYAYVSLYRILYCVRAVRAYSESCGVGNLTGRQAGSSGVGIEVHARCLVGRGG